MPAVESETGTSGATALALQTRNLVTADGVTLVSRRIAASGLVRGSAFVGHGQAHHSLHLVALMRGLAAMGWTTHATDLRGHGHSTSARAPLAHMDVGTGWDRLVDDMRLALAEAFRDVPWEQRLVVAPNIAAALVLEVLKSWPDLAARIVIAAPPTLNLAILGLARAFMAARVRLRPQTAPDDLALHQMYTFLAAQLTERRSLIDVISSDRSITDLLLADPFAWPTPTSGYFHEMFRGLAQVWAMSDASQVRPGTRLLILHGDEDPVTANGKFLDPFQRRLRQIGLEDISRRMLVGARSGLLIEEARFGISGLITDWADFALDERCAPGTGPVPGTVGGPTTLHRHGPAAAPETPHARIMASVLDRLGISGPVQPLAEDELVELCYNAIDDDSRWIELLYRLAHALGDEADLSQERLETVITVLMPHWERSFSLNRQIAQAAAVGTVLQNVIDRFQIGVAIVDADLAVLYANPGLARQLGLAAVRPEDRAAITQHLRALCDPATREDLRRGAGETLILRDGEPVGFHFRPAALRQTTLHRGGASGVVILRDGTGTGDAGQDTIAELLQFAYGLTRKEAETTLGLLDGLGAEGIGLRLGVSVNTVRTHLKRVYEKIEVQTQSELVARLLRGPIGLLVAPLPPSDE